MKIKEDAESVLRIIPNINDEVSINGYIDGIYFENKYGVIKDIKITSLNEKIFAIEFYQIDKRYHNCDRRCKDNFGWWVEEENISYQNDTEFVFIPQYFHGLNYRDANELVDSPVLFSDNGVVWIGPEILTHIETRPSDKRYYFNDYANFRYIKTCDKKVEEEIC